MYFLFLVFKNHRSKKVNKRTIKKQQKNKNNENVKAKVEKK